MAGPLKTDKLQADICQGLSAAQLAPYMGAVRESRPVSQDNAVGCTYLPVDVNQPALSLNVYSSLGPAALFAATTNFPWGQKISPISGYPARQVSQGGVDGPKKGVCQTAAAVADTASVEVVAQTPNPNYQYHSRMCTVSDKLIEQAIANLKAGG